MFWAWPNKSCPALLNGSRSPNQTRTQAIPPPPPSSSSSSTLPPSISSPSATPTTAKQGIGGCGGDGVHQVREEAGEGDRAGQVEGGRQQHQRERRPQDQREQAPLQEEQVDSIWKHQMYNLQATGAPGCKILPHLCLFERGVCNVWEASAGHKALQAEQRVILTVLNC